MMQDIFIVDAFTSEPFKGNPAAVCVVDVFPPAELMQSIAAEMNLSETAFVCKQSAQHYALKWFTPTVEVNLCGHATLAATHVLLQTGAIKANEHVHFDTMSGELIATATQSTITLDLPKLEGTACAPHPALAALGINILACERNRDNYLVEVADMQTLLACKPNMQQLRDMDLQGVIVTTATNTAPYDFASRYFGPSCGIDEDPVTGSAHCFLAPYWAAKLGKKTFRALQASTRQGVLDVTLQETRVLVAGNAVTTLKGQLSLPHSLITEKAA